MKRLVLIALAGCGRIGFGDNLPSDGTAQQSGSDGTPGDATGDGPSGVDAGVDAPAAPYVATAMHFASADDDYLANGALTGAVASTTAVSSMWLRITGADSIDMQLMNAKIIVTGGTHRNANNHIALLLAACNTTTTLTFESQTVVKAATGWVHLLMSWDTGNNKFDFFIDDVRDAHTATITNMTNCYTASNWGFGGLATGSLDADLADVYLATGVYMDLSIAANRAKFSNAAGKPVDLGPNCTGPTGSRPILCFTGDPGSWGTNHGTGGGFTVMGNGLTQVAGP